ncbi:hypothetical protein PIB30_090639 [Stylosanthes scabra]|uniref:Uncharacterized protein n=1 Tax=Stylosanthes scabra TaxID=79078 RepID=A0ABU6ZSY8_9FABA|nr:hypothetical protein [Stylosanthes scabra]
MLKQNKGLQHPRLGAHDKAWAWPSSNPRKQHQTEPRLGSQHQCLGDQEDIIDSEISSKKKCKRKLGKQENRGIEKTELQEKNRALTLMRHYPCLGMAEQASTLSPIQHSTPRPDARHLGVDRAARELALHQGLNA